MAKYLKDSTRINELTEPGSELNARLHALGDAHHGKEFEDIAKEAGDTVAQLLKDCG